MGASLITDGEGTVDYYYYGKEAGYSNRSRGGRMLVQHRLRAVAEQLCRADLARLDVSVAVSSTSLLRLRSPPSRRCVSKTENDILRYESLRSIAFSIGGRFRLAVLGRLGSRSR